MFNILIWENSPHIFLLQSFDPWKSSMSRSWLSWQCARSSSPSWSTTGPFSRWRWRNLSGTCRYSSDKCVQDWIFSNKTILSKKTLFGCLLKTGLTVTGGRVLKTGLMVTGGRGSEHSVRNFWTLSYCWTTSLLKGDKGGEGQASGRERRTKQNP